MKPMRLLFLFLFLLLFSLGACATADSVKYYALPDSEYLPPPRADAATLVEVVLADYLASASMVYSKTSDETTELTKNHLWAGNLSDGIRNVLTNELNAKGASWGRSFAILSDGAVPKIVVHVDRFQGNDNGTVLVAGYVDYFTAAGQFSQSFPVKAVVRQQKEGYSGMTLAFSGALKEIAGTIMSRIGGF